MRPVPVVHVITKLEFGGAQQNTLYTVAHLDRSRFSPVLVTGEAGYLMSEAKRLDLPLHVVPSMVREVRPALDAAAYSALKVLFLKYYSDGPCVVHTHSSKAGILGRWAALRAHVPVIVHSIHGFGFNPGQPAVMRALFRGAEIATSRITTHFIAVSEANRLEGIRLGLFPPWRCTVVRSGFDLGRFRGAGSIRPTLEKELGLEPGSPLVLMVACLKPQKAPLDFVGVAARVRRTVPRAHFLLAGDGELSGAVRASAERMGVEDCLHLLGWREDVPELMRSCDILLLTSRWEGLPRVIPQAKAAGLPVVATAVDGSVEAVRDGVDGYLCAPGDVGAMADRVSELLADPFLAGKMGQAGSLSVDEFDQDAMVRKQEELYSSLLEGARMKPRETWT